MRPLILYTHPSDHFRGVTKMIELGCCAKREIDDFMLPPHNEKP